MYGVGLPARPSDGNFHEMTEQPFPPQPIREKSRAPLGPNGHEIMPPTAVVLRGTSQPFCKKGHVKRLTPNLYRLDVRFCERVRR